MSNPLVGYVTSINGNKIEAYIINEKNIDIVISDGKFYSGIKTGGFVGIKTGSDILVARVERKFLEDKKNNQMYQEFSRYRFEAKMDLSLVGSIKKEEFKIGWRKFPDLFNEVVLLNEKEVNSIFLQTNDFSFSIEIGNLQNFDLFKIRLPVENLFNSHIGIFGNTGSGKSNTLTTLYTKILEEFNVEKSKIYIFDFNGEYDGNEIFLNNKKIIYFSNFKKTEENKKNRETLKLIEDDFLNEDVLLSLFSLSQKTQKPFLSTALKNIRYEKNGESTYIDSFILKEFKNNTDDFCELIFKEYKKNYKEKISKCVSIDDMVNEINYMHKLYISILFLKDKDAKINSANIDKMLIRVKNILNTLSEFIEIKSKKEEEKENFYIYVFKGARKEVKKIIPIIIAKKIYKTQQLKKNKQSSSHLIIDEAHNILSDQLTNEVNSLKESRLDLFEEMIKEGRKFGLFLTIATQRPTDISSTILSQLHNYFIHRLVNENDLRIIDKSISFLDEISKKQIPNLAPGQCIISGTAFNLPVLVNINQVKHAPNSETVKLSDIWKQKTKNQNQNERINNEKEIN